MAQVQNVRTGQMQTVKVGDVVGFKSDYEQYGRIAKISGDRLTLENNPDGFGGEYLRYKTATTEHTETPAPILCGGARCPDLSEVV